MLNEVKHLALSMRDSSAAPQNDTHHLTCDGPLAKYLAPRSFDSAQACPEQGRGDKFTRDFYLRHCTVIFAADRLSLSAVTRTLPSCPSLVRRINIALP